MEVRGTIRFKNEKVKIKLNAKEREIKNLFKKVYFIGYINNVLVKHNRKGWWIKEGKRWRKMNKAYWKGLKIFW